MKIIENFLKPNTYYAENTVKTHICLHHTVSGLKSLSGVSSTFNSQNKVCTTYYIEGDGMVYQFIPESYWSHHLGMKTANNTKMNKCCIGIELSAFGPVTLKDGVFYNAYNRPISDKVEKLDIPFRGYTYYMEYPQAQIDALKDLILFLSNKHNIPLLGLNKTLNFELLPQNEYQKPGIYNHTSFRSDKSDCYPSKKLIKMLNEL